MKDYPLYISMKLDAIDLAQASAVVISVQVSLLSSTTDNSTNHFGRIFKSVPVPLTQC